ncbi:MAG: inositol monophosphatase [Rhodoblastus sp.]|nr:MAG: inositol monophosphatase [Rhodoblastus sp.]
MSFSRRDLDRLAAIVVEAARREVTPRFRKLTPQDVRAKSSASDLVTEADEAAERFIAAALTQAFAGCAIVGEEAAARDPGLVAALGEAELAFVVDPVDGTLNFASDLPMFAVMAAAVVKGETAAAVIHDPVLDDSALALRGGGAWLERADGSRRDLRVGPARAPAQMNGMAGWRYFPEPARSRIPAAFPAFESVATLRCCGQEYRLAAAGGCDFLLYGRLNPWDHAAGVLLHQEAGGVARMLDGAPYRPGRRRVGLLCANTPESWSAARACLFKE